MSAKPLILIFLCLLTTVVLKAQDKPLKKYSKKDLIEMVERQELQLAAQNKTISTQIDSMASLQRTVERVSSKGEELNSKLIETSEALAELETEYAELSLNYEKLLAEPPKDIEVLDLYSYGYQPYKYNERQYQQHLAEAREDIIKARLANVHDLVRLLQSHKIEEDVKKSLYLGFILTYKGYLEYISQDRLTYYNEALESEIKKGITQKTYNELDIISKENRWIQILERF